MTSAEEWIRRYAERLGTEAPDAVSVDALLGMAGVAAHASERTAAPISAWIAGRAGVSPEEALGHARSLADELAAGPGGAESGPEGAGSQGSHSPG